MPPGEQPGASEARYGVDTFTVPAVLDARAAQWPDRVMMQIAGEPITFTEMRDRSCAAANALQHCGVSEGDTVALFGSNSPAWVYFWLGAARIGAIPSAVNASNKGDFLRHALAVTQAKLVFTDSEERLARTLAVADSLPALHTVLGGRELSTPAASYRVRSLKDLLQQSDQSGPPSGRARNPDDFGALFYTSGTTGPSKAVAISWRYLFTLAATVASAWEFSAHEVIWSAMPLFHISAAATVLAPMLVGGTSVLAESFHPTQVWDEIRSCGAVGFVGAGAMLSMLWNLPAAPTDSTLPLRFISAAPVAADIFREIERRYTCRIVTMYGLTEAFPIAVKPVADDGIPGTSGRVNEDFEVAILEGDQPVAPGASGEIACRARRPGVMSLGYLDPDHSNGLFVREHDEWFRTGDMGRLDEAGNLTYVDRVKDSIRRRGENVSSVEVEAVVSAYPSVIEAAAVGVDSDLGEQDILVAVTIAADHPFDPGALLDFCAERMPYFCVPRYVRVIDELPKNALGRLRKDLLRQNGIGRDTWDREDHGYVVHR
ncbi:ATP-dependent acyl-CoA ligase [Mycobacteriaceae bacterium 1482268.1]|nr:ATP-dependent acyl-CoA ligase [Mycobacteriaceae bacterium 1482268.1]